MEAILGLGYFEIVLAVLSFFFIGIYIRQDDNDGFPRNWPVVGMMPWLLSIVSYAHDACAEYLSRYGRTLLFKGPWFAHMDMLFTVDPANVRYILSDNFHSFTKGGEFKQIFDVLGDGVVNSEGESWRNQRKHSQFLFKHHQFRTFLEKICHDKLGNGLIPLLDHLCEQGQEVDMQDVFQRFSVDITTMFVTGYDVGSLSPDFPEVPFSKAMDDAWEVIFTRHVVPITLWKLMRWLNIGSEKRMSDAKKTIDDVLYGYVTKKRQELSTKGSIMSSVDAEEEGVDLLTLYLTNEDVTLELENNDEFVRDIVLNHILAGRDTTSAALSWFLWLVITHPKVEAKIRLELEQKVPPSEARKSRTFSEEELSQVPYLYAAISEALRLYPPVPFQHKEPIKDDILPSGDHVRPKLRVMFSLYAMARNPDVWGKDCCEFKPERWILADGSIKHVPAHIFTTFSAGPRTCLGKAMAYTQLKAAAAAVLHNYNFQLVEGHPVLPNLSMILFMQHGMKVKVTNRWA